MSLDAMPSDVMPSDAMPPDTTSLRIARKEQIARDIYLFELRDPGGSELPPFTAGAHVKLRHQADWFANILYATPQSTGTSISSRSNGKLPAGAAQSISSTALR